jgi:hypothetical protein
MFLEKKDADLFKLEIKNRGISRLIHFTPVLNLLGIMESGYLYSRKEIEELDINATDILDYVQFNDPIRYDDKSYINLSVQRPNWFLFKRFIDNTICLPYINWCVLSIDPKYIYHQSTLFSITNAANKHNQQVVGITGDIDKFLMMFSKTMTIVSSRTTRMLSREGLPDCFPTHEQAEILVNVRIPISDIISIAFAHNEHLAAGKAALSGFDCSKFKVDNNLFQE